MRRRNPKTAERDSKKTNNSRVFLNTSGFVAFDEKDEDEEEEIHSHRYECSLQGNPGALVFYPNKFTFVSNESNQPLVLKTSWSVLEVVPQRKSDRMLVQVCNSIKWEFTNIDNRSDLLTIMDEYTRSSRDPLERLKDDSQPNIVAKADTGPDPLVDALLKMSPLTESRIPDEAIKLLSEEFPIDLASLIALLFSKKSKFFQNLHSRRDSKLQYGEWNLNTSGEYTRTVSFSTLQAPITVDVTQTHILYYSDLKHICLDVENKMKGNFPGKLAVYNYHRITEISSDPPSTRVEVFSLVEFGNFFVGRSHARREAIEDIKEYCSRLKTRIRTAGEQESMAFTTDGFDEVKSSLTVLEKVVTEHQKNRGRITTIRLVLIFLVILQAATLLVLYL